MKENMVIEFYKNKRVLVTGHTGFKGTWLCRILLNAGAIVVGYSLEPPTIPNLYEQSKVDINPNMYSIKGDIRDYEHLKKIFDEFNPEIVFHLAAQPIVRTSYQEPRYTYETNVMGTVNLLECIRLTESVRSVLNITTDKVYRNNEWCWGYREEEPLDGFDPYSNSKSCSELVTHAYKNSFFEDRRNLAVSTARAGNVVGGGDYAVDRIIPDCVRAVVAGKVIAVRNPYSVRPYQHVLEPLAAYLRIVMCQYEDNNLQGYYNIGPDDYDCISTGELVEKFCKYWGEGVTWESRTDEDALHEASYLKLDCSLIKKTFGWKPRWNIDECMKQVICFNRVWVSEGDIPKEMDREIEVFFENEKHR